MTFYDFADKHIVALVIVIIFIVMGIASVAEDISKGGK